MNAIVFHFPAYKELAAKVAEESKSELGAIEIKKFPDGERYFRIVTESRDRDVVLVGGTVDDVSTLELFDIACGLVQEGARSLKIVIPFFGYSTMERAVRPGEIVTAKTRARLLSAIPQAPYGNEVLMLDLHSEGIPFYFEGSVKTRHLYAKSLIMKEAQAVGGKNFTLGSVDAGRAKWVESLANDMGVPAGFVYKRRSADGKVAIAGVNVSVKGQKVVIYDDMIRSGSSLIQAAQAYKDAGATEIWALTTHGVFTPGALGKIKDSGLFEKVVCTDSHPSALLINDPFLRVVSVAPLIANALQGKYHA
jgi:ribose-phosphate pyrophosphokinase